VIFCSRYTSQPYIKFYRVRTEDLELRDRLVRSDLQEVTA